MMMWRGVAIKKAMLSHDLCSAPTGIRTPVLALKGLRPSPLDDEGKAKEILANCAGESKGSFHLAA